LSLRLPCPAGLQAVCSQVTIVIVRRCDCHRLVVLPKQVVSGNNMIAKGR
jgi:hypothetical protein